LGYLGGGLLLALNLLMIKKPGFFGIPEGTLPVRLSFLSVAVWWSLFSIPIFKHVKEKANLTVQKIHFFFTMMVFKL